ncbi:MAG TPA: putative glycolipid-binding domain-containing protein [Vineibacter sp.]|nr:putative glycolipid-binding domain-containing protein [Vineibacter sp.]
MSRQMIARWQDWSGKGLEHAVLDLGADGIAVSSIVLAMADDRPFVVQYELRCDPQWRLREARIMLSGAQRALELRSDGAGRWTDGDGAALPQLAGTIDIDISVTPLTNTLPIRRLEWTADRAAALRMAYVLLPDLTVTADPQRYTCLEPQRRFRYESLDSDFTRDIEIDADGLVVTYPGLFRRVL